MLAFAVGHVGRRMPAHFGIGVSSDWTFLHVRPGLNLFGEDETVAKVLIVTSARDRSQRGSVPVPLLGVTRKRRRHARVQAFALEQGHTRIATTSDNFTIRVLDKSAVFAVTPRLGRTVLLAVVAFE